MGSKFKILGWSFIVIGICFILNTTFNLTGLVIFEEINQKNSSLAGIILVIIGLLILKFYRIENERDLEYSDKSHFKGRSKLRAHNHEAHYAARRHFMETYGRLPNKQELREYTRAMHETNELHDLVESHKHRKRSA